SNKIELENIEIDLITELREASMLLDSLADKKSINYKVDFDKEIVDYVYSDPTRLKQVITNLISNAIKFTPHRSDVRFSVKVLNTTSDTQMIRFSVKDNGIGIPKDKQSIIFSPYSQAQESTTREYGGTGLGLSISKSFVESFGGELLLDSKEGVGSDFYFDITFKISPKKREYQLEEKKELLSVKDMIIKANLKVLVAEDYEVNRTFIKLVLSKYKIKPDFVVDGVEALKKSQENSYDIIFMDVNMPNMGGVESTQNIRLFDKITPIIALTANTLEGDRERFLEAGMNDYLSKPLDRNKFEEILLEYVNCEDHCCCEDAEEIDEEGVEIESILEKIKLSFVNFNDQIIMKLVNTFVKSTDVSLQELKKAIDKKDFENIKSYAHKIAGSAGNLKLNHMYENARIIEIDASQEININYEENYLKIKRCFDKLKFELESK
ncbi:MAG: response regulator, partial [Campylobacterales bacterium]|nr:response regulator [Campylobacterales bacterium]